MFFNVLFLLGSDRPSGLLFSCRFTYFHTQASVLCFFSVSLSYFILAVQVHECLRKHSRMSYSEIVCFVEIVCFGRSFAYQNLIELKNDVFLLFNNSVKL